MSMTKQKLARLIDAYQVKVERAAARRGVFGAQEIGWSEQQNIDVLTALKMLMARWEKIDA